MQTRLKSERDLKIWRDKTFLYTLCFYSILIYSIFAILQIGDGFPSAECALLCVHLLANGYEPKFGGFGSRSRMNGPKFPEPVNFNFLFSTYALSTSSELRKQCLEMSLHTLTKMAHGGIHDHVGQVRPFLYSFTIVMCELNYFKCVVFRDSPGILWTANGTFLTSRKCSTIKPN